MEQKNQNNLGDSIKDMVQDAMNSIDFSSLNQNINKTVNDTIHVVKDQVNQAHDQYKQQHNQYDEKRKVRDMRRQAAERARQEAYERQQKRMAQASAAMYQPKKEYNNLYPMQVVNRHPVGRVGGVLMQVFGWLDVSVSTILLIVFGSLAASGWAGGIIGLGITAPFFLGGFILSGRGNVLRKRFNRFRRYILEMDGKMYCDIKQLAAATGFSHKFIVKDLKKMIKLRMLPQAHLDETEQCIMLDQQTYEDYLRLEEQRKNQQQEEQQKEEAKANESEEERMVREVVKEGKLYIQKINEVNQDVPGEEVSKKLYQLELVATKIFERVQEKPEKIGDLRKFMDYYMPTTLKLVCAYREFDQMEVQALNIEKAKVEIEQTLDTVNEAFANLLESLYEDEVMDISTDISVLQTMLKQEGLTKEDFNKEKKL